MTDIPTMSETPPASVDSQSTAPRRTRGSEKRRKASRRTYAIIALDGLYARQPLSLRRFFSRKRALRHLERVTRRAPRAIRERVALGLKTKAGWRVVR
jgi:hypothetical protein